MLGIEVAFLDELPDSTAISVKNDVEEDLGIRGIEKIRYSDFYYIDMPVSGDELRKIAEKVFTDPILQIYSVKEELFKGYNFLVEVKYHPDVTDNLGLTAVEGIRDFLGKDIEGVVRSAKRYYIFGKIAKKDAETIASKLLSNSAIETYSVREGK